MKKILLVLTSFLFLSGTAFAYPELVRHGYVNCISCHVSPNGGGVLTQYGRQLSKEVLSTWGKEGEEQFAYGIVKPPEWLLMGGDYRHLYLYRDTPSVREGKPIFMQADLEAAANVHEKFWIDATVGYQDPVNAQTFKDHLISRRHFLNYRPTDEISIRGGRFLYAYGINMPDHTVIVRGGLAGARTGLKINDEGYETYNLEAAWIGDRFNAFVTGIFGRPDSPDRNREKGIAINPSFAPGDTYKVGLSYLYGLNDLEHRHVVGPYGILGFTPHFFLLTELDFQFLTPKTGASTLTQSGVGNYQRLDYEAVQGLHFYLTQEFGRLDFRDQNSLVQEFGAGVQFFPRPHFEIEVNWQKQLIKAFSPDYVDVAWLLFHFYP